LSATHPLTIEEESMFNWIKENPKKSTAIAVALAACGGVYMIGGIQPAIQLFAALLNFFA
jgi:glucokinase